MTRAGAYSAITVIVLAGAVLIGIALRDRSGIGTPPAPSAAASAAATSAGSSPTATAAARSPTPSLSILLSDRFGFVVQSEEARIRSESSDNVISSFTPKGRSFTSLSRTVSPDGRFVAYWDPVDGGPVLHVRSVAGGGDRRVLTGRAEMSGSAFVWSSDSAGLVVALDNNCFEMCGGPLVAELWTVDLASGATEKVATGSIWLPVAWDRAAKIVAAGTTGPGGYLTGYDVIDLRRQPYVVRSTPFRPTVLGRLKAASDARYVLLSVTIEGGPRSLAWWPIAEPEKRPAVEFEAVTAEWRPHTSEIWWVSGREPVGCWIELCIGTQLTSLNVQTGARSVMAQGRFGSMLEGFRVDGTVAITAASATVRTELTLVEIASGRTAAVSISGFLEGAVALR